MIGHWHHAVSLLEHTYIDNDNMLTSISFNCVDT